MAVRQSSLCNQMRCDEIHRLPSSFHSPRNAAYVVLILARSSAG